MLAIVAQAVVRIGRRSLGNRVLLGVAAAAFLLIFFFSAPFPLIVLGAGVLGYVATRAGRGEFRSGGHRGGKDGFADADSLLGEALPDHARAAGWRALKVPAVCGIAWGTPIIALLLAFGPENVFTHIALFFSGAALVTFGGAYAVLGYVAQAAVQDYHWLRPGEMLDGLGMAETTPGPLIMVLQFVGFMGAYRDPGALSRLLAATLGGLLATWVTFAPCFLWIFLGAPYVERLRGNRALSGALAEISAAVVGVILNLALWFGVHAVFARVTPVAAGPLRFDAPVLTSVDPWALALSVAACIAVLRFNAGVLPTLGAAAAIGVALRLTGVR